VELLSGGVMTVASLTQHLHDFAAELRRLAYTMPGGHEDPLIRLSERMVHCASEQAAELALAHRGRAGENAAVDT
jgi:hypothetical protein